jgi:GNAT superfamily N-acetyltransferase
MPSDDMLTQLRRIEQSVSLAPVPDAGVEVVVSGVFRAFLSSHTADPELNYAMITAAPADGQSLEAELAALRQVVTARQRRLRLEFVEELWPKLGEVAARAGLRLVNREPLMTCTPESFLPITAPGVRVRFLRPDDDEATLATYLAIRDEVTQPADVGEASRLRKTIASAGNWFALANLEGEPAGTGRCIFSAAGLGEIIAIVTRADLRRRGVAATVVSALVRAYLDAGGTLAWLTAANDEATSVYRRVGFTTIGHLLNEEWG